MTEAQRGRAQEARERQDVVPVPTFLQPTPRRQDSADPELTVLQTPSDVPTEHHRANDAEDYATDSADVKGDDQPTDGPFRASTGDQPVRVRPLVTAEQLNAARALADAILMGATALLNRKTRVHEHDDRWLMDPAERKAISAPLARIVARRSPIPTGGEGDASDLADGVEAVLGLVSYVIGQMTAERPAVPVFVPIEDAPAQAGPGATLSPLDPAYRAG